MPPTLSSSIFNSFYGTITQERPFVEERLLKKIEGKSRLLRCDKDVGAPSQISPEMWLHFWRPQWKSSQWSSSHRGHGWTPPRWIFTYKKFVRHGGKMQKEIELKAKEARSPRISAKAAASRAAQEIIFQYSISIFHSNNMVTHPSKITASLPKVAS